MQNTDLPYWVALSHCLKLGPARMSLLRRSFSTMAEVWTAPVNALKKSGLEEAVINALLTHRGRTDVEKIWTEVEKLKLKVVTITQPEYPKLLKEIFNPPALLFYRGNLESLRQPSLAVVGSRRATAYGLRVTEQLVNDIAIAGVTIISGLAYGIDAAAHQAALSHHAPTVGVVASGLDQIYPTAHYSLAQEMIAQGGAVISEFPPRTAPLKQNFPFRNRIIAGLASGTLVVEAAEESGALITAKAALEANREVFAVPGSILSEFSKGTNELLKLGAHVVTSGLDILNVYGLKDKASPARPELKNHESALLEHLDHEPLHIDELVRKTGQPAAMLLAELMVLELSGYVREVGSHQFVKMH